MYILDSVNMYIMESNFTYQFSVRLSDRPYANITLENCNSIVIIVHTVKVGFVVLQNEIVYLLC